MPATVRGNSVRDRLETVTSGAGKSLTTDSIARILRRSIDDCGVAHKVIEMAFGVNPSYLSGMLSGDKPLTVERIERLPADVFDRFVQLLGEARGMTVTANDPHSAVIADAIETLGRLVRLLQLPRKVGHTAKVTR